MSKQNKLKVYIINRNDRCDYDEYDGAVVVAKNEATALASLKEAFGLDYLSGWGSYDVNVEEVNLVKEGVVLSSFNAG